jgi:hypothetical protein
VKIARIATTHDRADRFIAVIVRTPRGLVGRRAVNVW